MRAALWHRSCLCVRVCCYRARSCGSCAIAIRTLRYTATTGFTRAWNAATHYAGCTAHHHAALSLALAPPDSPLFTRTRSLHTRRTRRCALIPRAVGTSRVSPPLAAASCARLPHASHRATSFAQQRVALQGSADRAIAPHRNGLPLRRRRGAARALITRTP